MELTLIDMNVICDALNKLQSQIASNLWALENDKEISPVDAYDVMQGLMKAHAEVTSVFIKATEHRDKLIQYHHDRNTPTDRYAFKLAGEATTKYLPCSLHNPGRLPLHVFRTIKNQGR